MSLAISVAMCTYNGARFLTEQLNSIACQTKIPDELVICDDRSTDGSAQIVSEFSRHVSFPVRFVVNEQTLGSTKNFEQAISICAGEIVVLADQDDVWYPGKLQRIAQAFLHSKAVAAFSDADVIDDSSRPAGFRLWQSFSFPLGEQKRFAAGQALNILIKHPVVTGAAMAFRRGLFPFLAPIPANDIHDRWMSFLLATCGRYQLIPEPLMQYRRHHNQQVGMGALTFRDRFARARVTGRDLYLSEIERFRQLYARLQLHRTDLPNAAYAMAEIDRKISHLEHRLRLRETNIARVPQILREVCKHSYWRYGAGWESVAKDLFMNKQ
ncbi:MAG: glycosyltransferase family 2 protein [Candidatus Sulfotelmatobacter sp.]